MPAPLRITLTPEEDRTLSELRVAPNMPRRDSCITCQVLIQHSSFWVPTVNAQEDLTRYDGSLLPQRTLIPCAYAALECTFYGTCQGLRSVSNVMNTPSERRFDGGKHMDWEAYGNPQVGEQNQNGAKQICSIWSAAWSKTNERIIVSNCLNNSKLSGKLV